MNFKEYEEKGRAKLRRLLESSPKVDLYHFTTDAYDHIDCFTTGINQSLSAYEIKDRDIPSDKYNTILLEKIKYDALMEVSTASGYTPYFITFFNDGLAYLWDVSKLDITPGDVQTLYCTSTCGPRW